MSAPTGGDSSGTHWHHAVIEPPDNGSSGFRFNPEPRTLPEAKSAILPLILLVDIGPIISLADLCQHNAVLATKWLCGTDLAIESGGHIFLALDCETGDCQRSYVAFRHMVADYWSQRGRPGTIVPCGQDSDVPDGRGR